MSHTRFSTPEASQALGIPVHVITYWLGQIPYPAEQDAQGQWRLTPEAMGVLQAVKDLKERNASMEEIRRHVRQLQEAMPVPVQAQPGPVTFVAPAPAADDRAWGIPTEAPPKPAPKPMAQQPAPKPQPQPPQRPAKPTPPRQPAAMEKVIEKVVEKAPSAAAPSNEPPATMMVMAQRYAQAAHQIGRLEAENEHLKATVARAARDADEAKCRIAELEAVVNKPKPKTRWWAWLAMGALL